MKNNCKPFIGLDSLKFGVDRQELRRTINSTFIEVKRNEFAVNSSDYYEELGFFVEYTEEDICEAIEFTNDSNLHLDGKNLFSLTYSQLRDGFDKLSKNKEVEEEIGVTYYDLGFGASKEFDSDRIESIIIFNQDYWND